MVLCILVQAWTEVVDKERNRKSTFNISMQKGVAGLAEVKGGYNHRLWLGHAGFVSLHLRAASMYASNPLIIPLLGM